MHTKRMLVSLHVTLPCSIRRKLPFVCRTLTGDRGNKYPHSTTASSKTSSGPPVSEPAWSVQLSAKAGQVLRELPDHGQDMARDVLDIATRTH